MIAAGIILSWLACSFITYGATLAYFWRKFPSLQGLPGRWEETRGYARIFGAVGPVGLLVTVVCAEGYRYGFLWRRP